MPEDQPVSDSSALLDRGTRWFLAAVVMAGLVYAGCGWTPSSYGIFLQQLHAPNDKPVAGTSRFIRLDEWGLATPYFQAAVRNRFQRINETSFYREDLRNFLALPLKDWSLLFKPQLWAFFLLPPASAYSIYFAVLMCGFLAGYHFLFRQLGAASGLAAAAALMVYFSGFVQFWWTTYGPLLAGLPWVLFIVLRPMRWWIKALLCAWAFPTLVFAHVYPTLLLALAWGSLIVILAVRPSLLRSPGTLAAIGAGALSAALVVYAYYADVIPIMRNTIYPGHRSAPSGTTSIFAVFSEIFPFFCFSLNDYRTFTPINICEMGAVGSFFPLLTLFATRYRALRDHASARNGVLVLLAGFIAITLWEVAPVPDLIGGMLLWNTGSAERWMFTSGLLLTIAAVLVWSNHLVTLTPFRVILFLLIGPVAAVLLKMAWLAHKGATLKPLLMITQTDLLLYGFAVTAGISALSVPASERPRLLLAAVALMNVYVFSRFNPLQPAGPIFQVPETAVVRDLRKEAAGHPDGVVLNSQFYGSTLNGLGFRSVAHILMAPRLELFRQYFPTMEPQHFNTIFNRYALVRIGTKPVPDLPIGDMIELPKEVFVPIRGVRRMEYRLARTNDCSQPPEGAVDEVSPPDPTLTIKGWAPWSAETDAQGIRVLSARSLRLDSLSTTLRPDIAEQLQDYNLVKAGFQLQISSTDGKPILPSELVLVAFGTSHGEVRLACCGCR